MTTAGKKQRLFMRLCEERPGSFETRTRAGDRHPGRAGRFAGAPALWRYGRLARDGADNKVQFPAAGTKGVLRGPTCAKRPGETRLDSDGKCRLQSNGQISRCQAGPRLCSFLDNQARSGTVGRDRASFRPTEETPMTAAMAMPCRANLSCTLNGLVLLFRGRIAECECESVAAASLRRF
jgi:hypothetical protein